MSLTRFPLQIYFGATQDLAAEAGSCAELAAAIESSTIEIHPVSSGEQLEEGARTVQSDRVLLKQSHALVLLIGENCDDAVYTLMTEAIYLYQRGVLAGLFVFFKQPGPDRLIDLVDQRGQLLEMMRLLKRAQIPFLTFLSSIELPPQMRQRLMAWLETHSRLLSIAQVFMPHLDEGTLETMRARERPWRDEIIDLQHQQDEALVRKRSEAAYLRYVNTEGKLSEVEYYLTARFLFCAISENRSEVCRHKPFIFPIHQQVAQMVRSAPALVRKRMVDNLLTWLMAKKEVYQTSRDFAAFELGMCHAYEAEAQLLSVLSDYHELYLVRYYAAFALGMLRSASAVRPLVEIYQREWDQRLRQVIAHALLFTTQLLRQRLDVPSPVLDRSAHPTPVSVLPAASPRVFISYSHDNASHRERTLQLANALRHRGIDCEIDQYVEDRNSLSWAQWTEQQIDQAQYVLAIITEIYSRRMRGEADPGKGRGAIWEGNLIRQKRYDGNGTIIPTLFEHQDVAFVPPWLSGLQYYCLEDQDGFELLYRKLTGQPRVAKPEIRLGNIKV